MINRKVLQLSASPSVAFFREERNNYPSIPPYHPNKIFPELNFLNGKIKTNSENQIYDILRFSFKSMSLDEKNFGEKNWNPFGDCIKPGYNVVLKPNAVLDYNQKKGENVFASISHGSIIRAIVDYVFIALKGKGSITIADAPLMNSDFKNWIKLTNVDKIRKFYKDNFNFNIKIIDLRETYSPMSRLGFSPSHLRAVKERDPKGYKNINLFQESKFANVSHDDILKFYGSEPRTEKTVNNHLHGNHRYRVSSTILDADTIISIPKLKTHMKVGTTLNMKNMVGTQGDKNFIPHCKIGGPSKGGDEYPNQNILQNALNKYRAFLIEKLLTKGRLHEFIFIFANGFRFVSQKLLDFIGKLILKEKYIGRISGGSWYGNDTAWRMTIDLIKIILYVDNNGIMRDEQQRNFISIVDGIITGDEEGPLSPTEKKCGCIFVGFDPLAVDIVATRFMGFDVNKIKLYKNAMEDSSLKKWGSLQNINIKSNIKIPKDIFNSNEKMLDFEPSKGWMGHIKINDKYKD